MIIPISSEHGREGYRRAGLALVLELELDGDSLTPDGIVDARGGPLAIEGTTSGTSPGQTTRLCTYTSEEGRRGLYHHRSSLASTSDFEYC